MPARTSATRSTSGVSCSWPIADTTGVAHAATARTSRSSENGSRSSKLPPPRASTITSTSASLIEPLQRRQDLRHRAGALHGRLDHPEPGRRVAARRRSRSRRAWPRRRSRRSARPPAAATAAAACAPAANSPSLRQPRASAPRSARSSWPSPNCSIALDPEAQLAPLRVQLARGPARARGRPAAAAAGSPSSRGARDQRLQRRAVARVLQRQVGERPAAPAASARRPRPRPTPRAAAAASRPRRG